MSKLDAYSDQELLSQLKEGSDPAFKMLYQRYWGKLLHFAAQKTGDVMEAENMVQDIFVSLWNRRETLQVTSDFSSYLMVSVKYRVMLHFDKLRVKRLHAQHAVDHFDILDDSTQQYLDFDELSRHLEEQIARLPEKSALIYRMSKEEGMSHKQIAAEMGMSEKAVNSRLVRSRKTLLDSIRSFLHTVLL